MEYLFLFLYVCGDTISKEREGSVRGYLRVRLALLQHRYCLTLDQLSLKSRSASLRSASRLTIEVGLLYKSQMRTRRIALYSIL